MPILLTVDDLKEALKTQYSKGVKQQSKILRKANIDAFLSIDRRGLSHNSHENRLTLYSTLKGEKICIQYPGKESQNATAMPLDFRPKLVYADGTVMQDASFGFIWDIIEGIGKRNKTYLSFVATLFFYVGHMCGYSKKHNSFPCEKIRIDEDQIIISPSVPITLSWYSLSLPDDVWFSLNNYIQEIPIPNNKPISFEAFIKFVDLLLQNEDCKYYYQNVTIKGDENYKLQYGRTNTADANLLVIDYFEENKRVSELLNSFQKSRGVPAFKKSEYSIVTGGIVSSGG